MFVPSINANKVAVRPVGVFLVMLVLFTIMGLWDFLFSELLLLDKERADYLARCGIVLSVFCLAKYALRREGLDIAQAMFLPIHSRNLPVLCLVVAPIAIAGLFGSGAVKIILLEQFAPGAILNTGGATAMKECLQAEWSESWLYASILASAVLVPIMEEIVFRGLALRSLCARYSTRLAIILQAALFAVIHDNDVMFGAFLFGILAGLLAREYGSLYAPILVHGLCNLRAELASPRCGLTMTVELSEVGSPLFWWPQLSCVAFASIAIAWYFFVKTKAWSKEITPPVI